MHAVLITFESTVPAAHLAGPFRQYAVALQDIAGLMATDGFSNFQVRHFEVLEGLHPGDQVARP